MLVIVLGIDPAQKPEAIFNVRIDFEQFLSLVGILIMKSTIKNSRMVVTGLYNLCVFSSPDFLLGLTKINGGLNLAWCYSSQTML